MSKTVAENGAAAASAASSLARRLTPSPNSRAATLADHARVAGALETCTLALSRAIGGAAHGRENGLREVCSDTGWYLETASAHAAEARTQVERMVRRLGRRSEQARVNKGRSLLVSARWASESAEALDESTGTARMSAGAASALADTAFEMIPSLQSAFGNVALLIGWACEDCGMGRESERAINPLVIGLTPLRHAMLRVHILSTELRDVA